MVNNTFYYRMKALKDALLTVFRIACESWGFYERACKKITKDKEEK